LTDRPKPSQPKPDRPKPDRPKPVKSTKALDRLVNAALAHIAADTGDDVPLELLDPQPVFDLCRRTDATALGVVIELTKSADSVRRRLGAFVLGSLGEKLYIRNGGVFREERYHALRSLLETEMATAADPDVLSEICMSFALLRDPRATPILSPLIDHSRADIRSSIALALSGYDDETAIEGLIRLSADPEKEVREFATTGFTKILADTAPIRAALHARLADSSGSVRQKAISALVNRQDRTVLPFLSRELSGPWPYESLDDARKLPDPSLCPALEQAWETLAASTRHSEYQKGNIRELWRLAMAACGGQLKDR